MKFSVAPDLDGLAALARKDGLDMRPILLRVLTDLYVQEKDHTPEEERHYADLVLRFIGAADAPTRAIVARKLAAYAAAPPEIVARLARDTIDVAEPVLRHSPALSRADLNAVAAQCAGAHAAIARERLRDMEPAPAAANAARPAAEAASAAAQPACYEAAELGARFLSADGPTRRAMLAALHAPEADPPAPLHRSDESLRRLELAALRRRTDDFAREIERALSISRAAAEQVARDDSGEALVVALKALAAPSSLTLRVLLFLNPRIGEKVDRVFELTQLYDGIALTPAMRIVASLQRHGDAPRQAKYQPSFAPDAAPRGPRELLSAISESLSERAPAAPHASRARTGQGAT